jgi:NAD(P)-dependent dehydrogenase (short-subunit alcohol dehydrogenase family)
VSGEPTAGPAGAGAAAERAASADGGVAAPAGRPAALVTGSAKGVGRAVLLALAEDGFDVAVHYRRSREEAEEVAAAARALGVSAVALRADVTVEGEARGLVDAAVAAFGRLDVLVNNVGDYHHGPLAELDGETWRYMLDSNLNSTFYTCQQAVPHLRRSPRGGRIVNVGYAGSQLVAARPGIVAYGIAKTGVILYSKALAKVEARHGLTVNVVSPGVLENSVTKPLREIPMGRVGTLGEVTAAVRYLVSPEASYVTGVTLEVAGGWNL